jgi:cold shock protein
VTCMSLFASRAAMVSLRTYGAVIADLLQITMTSSALASSAALTSLGCITTLRALVPLHLCPDFMNGTVKFFNAAKGFGFIEPDEADKNVFIHASALEAAGIRALNEGDRVSFLEDDRRCRGKQAAQLKKSDYCKPSSASTSPEAAAVQITLDRALPGRPGRASNKEGEWWGIIAKPLSDDTSK